MIERRIILFFSCNLLYEPVTVPLPASKCTFNLSEIATKGSLEAELHINSIFPNWPLPK